MKIGTKTLLFGCHQFVIHPVSVYIAWRKLYGEFPSFGETIAIVIHDWGYFGKPNLDGKEGEKHPEWAFNIFEKISWQCFHGKHKKIDNYLSNLAILCLYHSRFYAKNDNMTPSKLCYADKYGTILYGKYLWTFLSTISGEAKEYMTNDKYEIYYKGSEKDGKFKWFTEYVKFIKPIIFKEIKKFKK